jgi:hypothetical protein
MPINEEKRRDETTYITGEHIGREVDTELAIGTARGIGWIIWPIPHTGATMAKKENAKGQ